MISRLRFTEEEAARAACILCVGQLTACFAQRMLRDDGQGMMSTGNHDAAEGALAGAETAAAAAGQALRFGPFGGPSARGQLPNLMRAAVAVMQAQEVRFGIWSTVIFYGLASQTMLTDIVACSLGMPPDCCGCQIKVPLRSSTSDAI